MDQVYSTGGTARRISPFPGGPVLFGRPQRRRSTIVYSFYTFLKLIIIIIIVIATIKGSAPVLNYLMEYLLIA